MKRIVFEISDDLHRKIKIKAITEGKTLKRFLVEMVEKTINEKNE